MDQQRNNGHDRGKGHAAYEDVVRAPQGLNGLGQGQDHDQRQQQGADAEFAGELQVVVLGMHVDESEFLGIVGGERLAESAQTRTEGQKVLDEGLQLIVNVHAIVEFRDGRRFDAVREFLQAEVAAEKADVQDQDADPEYGEADAEGAV